MAQPIASEVLSPSQDTSLTDDKHESVIVRAPSAWMSAVAAFVKMTPVILSCVFLFSSGAKIYSWREFEIYLDSVSILPSTVRTMAPPYVVFAEILCSCMLLCKKTRKPGLVFALGLLSIFTVFLVVQALIAPASTCNCFGNVRLTVDPVTDKVVGIARNLILVTLAAKAFTALK